MRDRNGMRVLAALLALGGSLLLAACKPRDRREGSVPDRETAGRDTVRFLLLGCDRAASLTDSILLVSVTPSIGDFRILQIPRDTYAAYTERDYRKLNGAYHALGADGTRDWLSSALGVPIDRVAVFDLDCLRRAVDAVGGVEVEIETPMHYLDPAQGLTIDLPVGRQHLDGGMAEQFVRYRAGYADADLGRLDAQKRFLSAFLRACSALTPTEAIRVCGAVLPSVQTDLPFGEAVGLALSLLRAEEQTAEIRTAPGEAVRGQSGAWYYVLNRAGMTDALAWWSGETPQFDAARLFDRAENTEFHRIYEASSEAP